VNAAPKDGLVVVAEKLDNGLTGSDEEEVLTIWYERDTQAHAPVPTIVRRWCSNVISAISSMTVTIAAWPASQFDLYTHIGPHPEQSWKSVYP
jgi:hypothetical protein